jgi:transcriptional regulator with XRE-family HTH domain
MAKSFNDLVERTTSKRTRERGRQRGRKLLGELLISEMRKLAGKSQREVAEALGIRQPSLSKLEGQSDMQISTLQRIVAALGGKLDVIARFPKGAVRIEQFDGDKTPRRSHRPSLSTELHLM